MKKRHNKLIEGTLLLTIAGFITRIIGFGYRIFLAGILGTRLLGIYQLVFPVYGICFTIYGAGIQTAISQLIASNIQTNAGKARKNLTILRWGLFFSLLLSLTLSAAVFLFSDTIASRLLLEPGCSPYLKLLCLLFPFCGTSACINGYFYGFKEAHVPAVTQIIEQLVRVGSVMLLCLALSATGEAGCRFAILGLVFGETASCLYNCVQLYRFTRQKKDERSHIRLASFLFHKKGHRLRWCPNKNFFEILVGIPLYYSNFLFHKKRHDTRTSILSVNKSSSSSHQTAKTSSLSVASSLLFLTFTLTITKLILSILHSVEAVFIPAALKQFGYSAQAALSIYGILSGIAMPFILFPSTITNSFSVMLLPAIAQAHAAQAHNRIRTYVTLSSKYSLYIGYLFTCIFLFFGKEFGTLVFHSQNAGIYICVLSWLCPFLYLSTTLTSIINGLGKTQLTFLITAVSLILKIYFLIFLVPKFGISAYLAGSLISQIVMTLLENIYLRKYILFSAKDFILIPNLCLLVLGCLFKKIYLLLSVSASALYAVLLIVILCLLLCVLYLLVLDRAHCIQRGDFSSSHTVYSDKRNKTLKT